MSAADIVIIIVIALILFAIVYFNFIKHRYTPCDSCPQKKRCENLNGESLKEYYRKVCATDSEKKSSSKSCCK